MISVSSTLELQRITNAATIFTAAISNSSGK